MDRVGGAAGAPLPRRDRGSAAKGRAPSSSEKTTFLGFLTKQHDPPQPVEGPLATAGEVSSSEIESLLDEVYSLGQDLVQNPSPENVVQYKKAVARFVRAIVDRSVEVVETEGRLRKDMKKPKYALLHVIDEKLDKLGAYVLQHQKDRLEILRRVDELHGILVDLKQ